MPAADWDTLEPTPGTPGNSYEVGVDVKIGGVWTNIPDITAVNPAPSPKTRSRATYAAKGQARPNTYGRDWALSFNVEIVRAPDGSYQDELQFLLDKASLYNEDNQAELRWFDVEGADYAFEGLFSIEHSRANTGDDDAGFFGFSCSSIGGAEKIPNPVNTVNDDPEIGSAIPSSGAAATTKLLVRGAKFTGATAAHVGATAATAINVYDDENLEITVPAGSAGPTFLTVTTPNGTSEQFPYTRGA